MSHQVFIADQSFNISDIKSEDAVIVTKKGALRKLITPMYEVLQEADSQVFSLLASELQNIETGATVFLPAISAIIYEQALAFFQDVYDQFGGEACVLLAMNRNQDHLKQKYRIIVPKQKVTGGSVDYTKGLKLAYEELREGEYFVGTIHSHPGFSAYQSNIDHKDEISFDGIHITLGYIKKSPKIETDVRFSFCGTIYTPNKDQDPYCFDYQPKEKRYYPPEWLDKVSKPRTGVKSTRYFEVGYLLSFFPLFRFNKPNSKTLTPFLDQVEVED